ncbi:MAG: GspH/FimT family pseudopilin [Planctomycetota bacterium]
MTGCDLLWRALQRNVYAEPAQRSCAGFTLLEVLLVLLLMTLLTSAGTIAVTGWQDAHALSEGQAAWASALRLARADAARTGQRLRLRLDFETGSASVEVEPDPLEAPGEWVPHEPTWADVLPEGQVRCVSAEYLDDSAYRDAWREQAGEEDAGQAEAIVFRADGSSDSVLLELAPLDEQDDRRVLIKLDGLNDTITRRTVHVDQLDAARQAMRDGQMHTDGSAG